MKIAYILFFGMLNILSFIFLTKKIKINKSLNLLSFILLGLFIIIHFVNPFKLSLPNTVFFVLLSFSLFIFIFHYGSKFAIIIAQNITNKIDDPLYNFFNIWTNYIFSPLIYIFQILTIIKN